MTAEPTDWDTLRGRVVLPGMAGYESLRKPAIARFHDARPQAVVECRTAEDVAATLAVAGRTGMPTATRSGGHCFAGRSSTDGIVIDVRPMRSISLSDGMVTVGAGARLREVYDALHAHRLTIPAGCGPEVGVSGLTLGGGLGILGRKHGLTSDSLVRARVVLADGRIVDCDGHREPELFWALRGAGGGMFGVVTSLVFRTLSEPRATSFRFAWPDAHAAAVIEAWQAWAPDAPGELAASLLIKASGEQSAVVNVFGAMLGSEAETTALLDELVAWVGAEPAVAVCSEGSYREAKRHLVELGEQLGPEPSPEGHTFLRSEFFGGSLPREAIAALVDGFRTGTAAGQVRELDFSPWGGAYNRVPPDATAFVHRQERFLLKHAVTVPADMPIGAAREWLDQSWSSLRPWGTGRAYQNFPDPDLDDWPHAYYGSNYERLVQVKARYDPDDFFRFHQSVPIRL
jgi:FAD/FMN-containing dehydrogenase